MSSIQDQYNSVSTERFLNCYIRNYTITKSNNKNKYLLQLLLIDDKNSGAILTDVPNIGSSITFTRGSLSVNGIVSNFKESSGTYLETINNINLITYNIISGIYGIQELMTNDQQIQNSFSFAEFTYDHKLYFIEIELNFDSLIQCFGFNLNNFNFFEMQNDYVLLYLNENAGQSIPFGSELRFNNNNIVQFIQISSDIGRSDLGYSYRGFIAPNSNKIILPYKTSSSSSSSSSSSTTTTTTPPVSIPVYNIKYFNSYVQSFTSSINSESCSLNITVAEDPSTGLVFSPPSAGTNMTFTFDSFSFQGKFMSYSKVSSASEAINRYLVILNGLEGVSNYSDKIFGLDVASVSVSAPSTTSLSSAGTTSLAIDSLVITPQLPALTNGSTFTWNSSPAAYYSITNAAYYSYSTTSMQTQGGTPIFSLQSKKSVGVAQVLATASSSGSTSNPSSGNATSTSSSSNGTTVTSNVNDYGAGTKTTVTANTTNLPAGVTTTSYAKDGLNVSVTTTVTASTVTTVEVSTFTPTLSSAPNAPQTRTAMGLPQSFNGAVDPMKIFPSVEIYPSSSYPRSSGLFFGRSVSPTSFDLDPYFFFSENDFRIAVKDGKTDSKNINLQKQSINSNARTMGLKAPMFYSGWGYDSRGLPVPNNVANNPTSGVYYFNPSTSTQRKLWKTGPIDLRWHDVRKVWVGGQEILEGYLKTDLQAGFSNGSIGTGLMSVMRVAGNKNGPPETLLITNRDPSLTASSGAYIMVVDINYEWRPIYVGC
jgi:hypothetical protein